MTTPKGVTVRKMGDPLPPGRRPRNLLEAAALEPDVTVARAMICTALRLPIDSSLAAIHLSEDYRWRRVEPWTRLIEIANWLKAECYECMDLVQCGEISTIGD